MAGKWGGGSDSNYDSTCEAEHYEPENVGFSCVSGDGDNYDVPPNRNLRGKRPDPSPPPPILNITRQAKTKPRGPHELKVHYEIVLDADFDKCQGKAEALVQAVKAIAADPGLKLTSTRRGSLVLVLEGSQEGFDKIIEKINNGELTAVAGVRIIEVRRVTHAAGTSIKVSERVQVDAVARQQPASQGNGSVCEPTSYSLRELMKKVMRSDAELEAFFLDHFRKVANDVAPGMSHTEKVNSLFRHATPAEIFSALQLSFPAEVANNSHLLLYSPKSMNGLASAKSY